MIELGSLGVLFHMEQGARKMERVFKESLPSKYLGYSAVQIKSITHFRWFATTIVRAANLRCICDLQRMLNMFATVPLQRGLLC